MTEPEKKIVEGVDVGEVIRRARIPDKGLPLIVNLVEAYIRRIKRVPFLKDGRMCWPPFSSPPDANATEETVLTAYLDAWIAFERDSLISLNSIRFGPTGGENPLGFPRIDLMAPEDRAKLSKFDQKSNQPLDKEEQQRFETQARLRVERTENSIKQALRDMGLALPREQRLG